MDSEALEREAGAANDGSAKRRQIMDGARQVFLSAGFDGASMNDVARAAGVSKGTLYAYFNSKEHLFEAIIRAEKAQSAERVCRFLHDRGDVRAVLADFGVRLLELMTDPGALKLARVVVAAADKFPSVGRTFYEFGPILWRDAAFRRIAGAREAGRAQGARSRARSLAVRRSLPELCLQTALVRRRRFGQSRRHRSLGRGRGRCISQSLWRLAHAAGHS